MKERKIISLLLSAGLLCAVPQVMAATVVKVDPSAGSSTRVGRASNGVTQVDIATPTAKGVSVNQYQQFDVDKQGVILNNSATDTKTKLAGWISGNANLSHGGAKVIVNQVNSDNPSQLNGYIEVAGGKADVIIANPSGISVNGGGFLNAGNVTLTTGKPVLKDGEVSGYEVTKGNINIGKNGLDTSHADYTQLLSKTARIQGKIAANDLKIVVGSNKLDKNGKVVQTLKTESVGEVGIDSSALGGMYAKRITIISTDNGAGVNLNGQTYTNDNLVLDTHGDVNHAGQMLSQGDIQIKTTGSLHNTGTIAANKHVVIKTGADLVNGKDAAGARHSLSPNSFQPSTLAVSKPHNNRFVEDLNDSMVSSAVQPPPPPFSNHGALPAVGGSGADQPTQPPIPSGAVTTKPTLAKANAGTIYAGQGVDINVGGNLSNQNGGLIWSDANTNIQTAGHLSNAGTIVGQQVNINANQGIGVDGLIYGKQAVALNANSGIVVKQGTVHSDGGLAINTNSILSNNGLITAKDLNLTVNGRLNNAKGGRIAAQDTLTINAANGSVDNNGIIASSKDIALFSDSDIHNNGTIVAGNKLQIATAGNLYNSESKDRAILQAGTDLDVVANGNIYNGIAGGMIGNTVNITSHGIFNNSGLVQGQQFVGIDSHGDFVNEPSGRIRSPKVNIATDGDFSNKGVITSEKGEGVYVTALGDVNNSGEITSDSNLSLAAINGRLVNDGKLHADKYISLSAHSEVVNHGSISSKGNIDLRTTDEKEGSVSNDGSISAKGNLNAFTKVFNYGGDIQVHNLNVTGAEIPSGATTEVPGMGTLSNPSRVVVAPQVIIPPDHAEISVADGGLTGTASQTIGEVEKNAQRKDSIQNLLSNLDTRPYHNAEGTRYLIETDKQYTDRKRVLSSDYMLERLSINPAQVMMRLGDGHFEQALVREQFQSMFGEDLFASEYKNMNYQTLMDNGIHYAQVNHIQIGTPLTAAQQKALKKDIVWLVRDKVYLPGSSHFTKVLYPKVYVANQD